ncbi:MAG: hypothetical protein KA369_05765 [Spirochaetes bacterium]|nr:hypothetical protein [Spirochaetota bacterium]
MIICKDLNESDIINSLKDWETKCPPAKDEHWKDGRNAKELGRAWITDFTKQGELINNLINQYFESKIDFIMVSPEFETRFDKYGSGRKHDLLIIGQLNKDKIVIGIEAKVDEPFSNKLIKEYLLQKQLDIWNGENSNVPARIEELLKAIFQKKFTIKHLELRYQLVYSIASILAEAKIRKAKYAFFIIEKFVTEKINQRQDSVNQKDLDNLISALSENTISRFQENHLMGPYKVPGNDMIPNDIELFLGMAINIV